MQTAGLYVHIPFCDKKCGYCDFYSIKSETLKPDYVNAVLQEIETISENYSQLKFDTIFFGGGTPTCLSTEQLTAIWDKLHSSFEIHPKGEFSFEANPGTIELSKLQSLKKLGFNRISIGAQSFNERNLKFLGRIHSVSEIIQGVKCAREAGFENINIDLMTAYPGLTEDEFRYSLQQAVDLETEHIACYTLIFEPNTPFYRRMERGELQPVGGDNESRFYEFANHFLAQNGYSAYEISNYSRTDKYRCKHNLKYWNHEPYLGFGPSAHSFIAPERWWNIRSIRQYADLIKERQPVIVEKETLNEKNLQFEYIFLHLRLSDGLNLNAFKNRFKYDFLEKYTSEIEKLTQDQFLEFDGENYKLSPKGWLLADEIAQYF